MKLNPDAEYRGDEPMVKKLCALLLAVCLGLCSFLPAACGFPERHTCGDYLYCLEEDGTACILNYYGEEPDLAVPETLDGVAVTRLGPYAYSDHDFLRTVTIPEGVTEIGNLCFYHCVNLARVNIPDSVAAVGFNPFTSCTSLTGTLSREGNSVLRSRIGRASRQP